MPEPRACLQKDFARFQNSNLHFDDIQVEAKTVMEHGCL